MLRGEDPTKRLWCHVSEGPFRSSGGKESRSRASVQNVPLARPSWFLIQEQQIRSRPGTCASCREWCRARHEQAARQVPCAHIIRCLQRPRSDHVQLPASCSHPHFASGFRFRSSYPDDALSPADIGIQIKKGKAARTLQVPEFKLKLFLEKAVLNNPLAWVRVSELRCIACTLLEGVHGILAILVETPQCM